MSTGFEFTPENLKEFQSILTRYPFKRAALLPTLHLAQEQNGFISPPVMDYVGQLLDVPVVDVREVVTFYSLYHQELPGRHHIRVCMSLSCWLRGADKIKEKVGSCLGTQSGGKTQDGKFSWEAVADCMGACEIAPMIQVDKDYYGNLTEGEVEKIIGKAD